MELELPESFKPHPLFREEPQNKQRVMSFTELCFSAKLRETTLSLGGLGLFGGASRILATQTAIESGLCRAIAALGCSVHSLRMQPAANRCDFMVPLLPEAQLMNRSWVENNDTTTNLTLPWNAAR